MKRSSRCRRSGQRRQIPIRIGGAAAAAAALLLALLAGQAVRTASANPMKGQPAPTPGVRQRTADAVRDLLRRGGDRARARPQLVEIVEEAPATDLTDAFAAALGDPDTYTAVAATYQDALLHSVEAAEPSRAYIRYNLARVYLLRAGVTVGSQAREPLLRAAAEQMSAIEREGQSDPATAELRGDIASIRGDVPGAIAAYGRIVPLGGSKVTADYKIGRVYEQGRQYGLAARFLKGAADAAASAAPAADPMQVYDLYQELAAAYYLGGDWDAAGDALRRSARPLASVTAAPPSPLRLDVARALLGRGGYARDVRVYLDAVARLETDDAEVKAMQAAARRSPH